MILHLDYIIIFKSFAALSIFALTVIAGVIFLRVIKKHTDALHLGDAFASGVFLSAALLHLLPDAEKGFASLNGVNGYPVAQLIAITVFVLLLMMERCAAHFGEQHLKDSKFVTTFLLILLLTLHSLIEGAAIGINASIVGASVIYFAVIAHKSSESFALATNLHHHQLPTTMIHKVIWLFALMTPLGVLIASIIKFVLDSKTGSLLEPIFNATATGTFLYLGTEHLIEGEKSFGHFNEIIALVLGITVMAVVAIWV